MENLKLTLTLSKDGVDTCVGFEYDQDVTKEDFIKYAQFLIDCTIRKLEIEKTFD
jgi:hypothetical protein